MSTRVQYYTGILDIIGSIVVVSFAVFLGRQAAITVGDESLFFEASFFCYLGAVFLYAYFNPKQMAVFRGIMWICNYLSFPQGRFMAIVYSALFFLYGVWLSYQWLFMEKVVERKITIVVSSNLAVVGY